MLPMGLASAVNTSISNALGAGKARNDYKEQSGAGLFLASKEE
jgi:Na+-driven multidrug efflux pump